MIVNTSHTGRQLMRCALPMGAALRFGGSDASTSTSTDVRDMRVVGGDASANVSANDSNVTVVTTDQGALSAGLALGQGGFALGSKGIDAAVKSGETLASTLGNMFDGVLKFAGRSTDQANANAANAAAKAAEGLQAAYAQSRTPDPVILKYAAVAVVVVVGLVVWANKRG